MRAYELEESAVDELKNRLPKLKRHSYDTIDHLMQNISVKHKITGKRLHDLFVKKYGHTPDTWIKKIKNKLGEQGVAEGSGQKPTITYKDYTLQYDYQTEDDDPEGYSTATTYYFDVFKDGNRVGEAEYFDYFGDLTIRINGKTKKFEHQHPLASQVSQLVSSLPDEQKRDLSDPKFESQGVAEGAKEDMSKEAKAMASGKCPHCHGPVEKKEHPTLTQYHCAKCGIRASIDKQGVAEGSLNEYGDTAKGQKMLTKVQKRAVDRTIKADDKNKLEPDVAKRDLKTVRKNAATADRAWERMSDKDLAESGRNRGYSHGFASPNAPSLGGPRYREDDEGWDREEREQTQNWYIRIDGKLLKDKQQQPYTFSGKQAAEKAARTMMAKDFNKGKKFTLTTSWMDAPEQGVKEESKGLWANIHAKRERIKHGSGEHMRKPGSKGAPTASALKKSAVEEGEVLPLKRSMNKVQHGKRTFPPTQRDVKEPEDNVTPLAQKKSNVSEGVEGPQDVQKIKDFIKWSYKTLNMQKPYPRITISKNTEVAQAGHHTGVHKGNDIWVYVGNRNLIDIFRTIFHELTHHRQMQLNMIKDGDSYPGSPIEMLADMAAGKYIKVYGKNHPEMFQ